MDLAAILTNGIAIADSVTKTVQGSITWEAFTGQDGYGAESYASPVTIRGIIDYTRRRRHNADGVLVTVIASVTILEVVTPNGASTNPPRSEPIDVRDRITLPNGATGPIMQAPGAVYNPAAARPFINDLLIGEPG